MFQFRLCVRTFYSVLLQNEKVINIASQPHSVLLTFRTLASQNICSNPEISDIKTKSSKRSLKQILKHSLRGIYDCSQEEISRIVTESPSLSHIDQEIIIINAKCLKENGLDKNTLINHSWVLGYNSELFPSALKLLKQFHHNLNISLPLLTIPYMKLVKLSGAHSKNKIEWLSEQLECDVATLSQIVARHHSVLRIPHSRILEILNILKDGGVALEDIVKDICIFNHNVDVMVKRLAVAKENSVSLKPWSLRCSETSFQRTIERRVKTKEILGDLQTVKQYLLSRLDCEEAVLLKIMKTIPQLKHISVMKVKELMDYLFDAGYCSAEVVQVSRILTRSKKTVKFRIEELHRFGLTHPNLFVICKTSKEYKALIKRLERCL